MTEAERHRLADEWFAAHTHEWDAYNALPFAERSANQDKIEATLAAEGSIAGRAIARALGMPCIPDELCDPTEMMEAQREMEDDEDPGNLWEPGDH